MRICPRDNIFISFLTIYIFLFFTSAIFGESAGIFNANILPTLKIPKISGKIKIDGKIDELQWQQAARASNFSEQQPGDMTKPPVETEVLVAYDDINFYMAFIAHDDPKAVRVSFRNRDEIWQDDNVGVILDTYGDGAWAYEIMTNPIGIQGDVRWSNNGGEDTGFDIVFESVGVVTDSGYQVEIAVPFKSLHFPNKSIQTWRATFWRNHPRVVRGQYSWAAISKNTP
jgi:hypothetical protein